MKNGSDKFKQFRIASSSDLKIDGTYSSQNFQNNDGKINII